MPYTPEGFLAVPITALVATIAASARFRTIVGASSAALAETKIEIQLADDEAEEGHPEDAPKLKFPRPRAIVSTVEDFTHERGGPGEWQTKQALRVSFEFIVPEQYRTTRREQYVWFTSQIGVILAEMQTARDADTDGSYLPFDRIECVQDPMPGIDDLSIEEYWGVEYSFFSQ